MSKLICKIIPWQEDIGSYPIKKLLYSLNEHEWHLEIRLNENLQSEIFVWSGSEFEGRGGETE